MTEKGGLKTLRQEVHSDLKFRNITEGHKKRRSAVRLVQRYRQKMKKATMRPGC